jgi:hypothetical protein
MPNSFIKKYRRFLFLSSLFPISEYSSKSLWLHPRLRGAKVVAGLFFCLGDILVSYCQILLARLYLIQKEEKTWKT